MTSRGTHRRLLLVPLLAAALLAPVPGPAPTGRAAGAEAAAVVATPTRAVVDFARVVQRTTPFSIGVGSSTYGANPLSSGVQAAAEERLDARYVRLPVGYRDGRVTTSAAGGDTGLDMVALAAWYRSRGYRLIVVLGGRTNDVDIQPGDATRIIRALGTRNVVYSTPNEPTLQGWTLERQVRAAEMITAEGRAVAPGFTLWGPTWAHYSRADLRTFAQRMGPARLGGVDYHHYAMGTTSISTEASMRETPGYGREVQEVRSDLRALGLPERVSVDELNYSWRFRDGTAPTGDNGRFFTAVNTVWTASALGHLASRGASGAVYATQNGPLGVTVEAGNHDRGRPAGSPMPAYWGIAAWTGAKAFPHLKDAFYEVGAHSDPLVETFAVNNEAGGRNLVLINKGETADKAHTVTVKGLAPGTLDAYQSSRAAPYAAPRKVRAGTPFAGSVSLTLPAMTVTTVVLSPGAAAPAPAPTAPVLRAAHRIDAAGGAVPGWTSGASLVSGGTDAANPGTTAPPAGVPAAVFGTERWGAQTWTLPVSGAGSVALRLHFSERYPAAQRAGARRFDVLVNGTRVAAGFEPWAAAGSRAGASATLAVTTKPVAGRVVVALAKVTGEPFVNAIEVDTGVITVP